MHLSPDMAAALEALYRRFAAPTPARIDGCPCCLDRKEVKTLHSKALREQTPADLSSYGASVFLTVGAEADFRYFLPRLLELSAAHGGWWPSPEVVLRKLKLAGWRTWSKADRAPVEQFLTAWLDQAITAIHPPEHGDWSWPNPEGDDLDVLVCGLARAEFPPEIVEERLFARPVALQALVALNGPPEWDWQTTRRNAFWDDAPEAWDRFSAFLKSEPVLDVLTDPK